MWAIRILNGPWAGHIFPLQPGKNTLGRGPTCAIRLMSPGISKEHAKIFVTEDKILVSDLGSRNGVFVNGVRIQNKNLSLGDKLMLHDLLADLVRLPHGAVVQSPTLMAPKVLPPRNTNHEPATIDERSPALAEHEQHADFPKHSPDATDFDSSYPTGSGFMGLYVTAMAYFDNVAMPGVYEISRRFEYRWVIASFVGIYVVMVTAVSVLPTLSMIQTSIEEESMRRAKTIARNLSAINRQAIIERSEMSVSVRMAELEEGVLSALVLGAKDGAVIAPVNLRGGQKEQAFAARSRKMDDEHVEKLDGSTIGASVPIVGFNPDTNMNTTLAYAIVLYDISSVVSQQGRALRLFVEILSIALLLGFVLYQFLFRLVERPIEELNMSLDVALREGREDVKTDFIYPRISALVANINSALARIGIAASDLGALPTAGGRETEAAHIVDMVPFACLAINALDDRVIVANAAFDKLVGGGLDLRGRHVNEIPDTALQQNLMDLIQHLRSAPDQVATGEIPFMGQPHEIRAQAVLGEMGHPAYFLARIRGQLWEDAA